jgi:hypothetical protein
MDAGSSKIMKSRSSSSAKLVSSLDLYTSWELCITMGLVLLEATRKLRNTGKEHIEQVTFRLLLNSPFFTAMAEVSAVILAGLNSCGAPPQKLITRVRRWRLACSRISARTWVTRASGGRERQHRVT